MSTNQRFRNWTKVYVPVALLWFLQCTAPRAEAPATDRGYRTIEGDILVRVAKPGEIEAKALYETTLWPNGVVPYEFGANVTAANQSLMIAAMTEWQNVANVQFRPRTPEDGDFVRIQSSTVNESAVGKLGRGEQIINIANWNRRFIMAHELAHTLGFSHEQSRSNRGTYIGIDLTNVAQTNAHNFNKEDKLSHYGDYDFDSVMHYGEYDFALNKQKKVITVLPPYDKMWDGKIGQRDHLSYWDRRVMSFLYPQSDWRFVDPSRPCVNGVVLGTGSFIDPYHCFEHAERKVPDGGTIVFLVKGVYSIGGLHTKPLSITAGNGAVTLLP